MRLRTGVAAGRSLFLPVLFCLCNAAYSQQILSWEVSGAALAAMGPTVTLRDRDKGIVATLESAQLRALHTAKERIGSLAGLQNTRLYVTSHPMPNAFAVRDKTGTPMIAISVPMLRALGADQDMMAAIVGHELGHLAKNHQGRSERVHAAEILGILASIVSGMTIRNQAAAEIASRAGGLGARALILSYDRDQERDADAFGVEYMTRAGYDPQGAVRLWSSSIGDANQGGIFSTHPTSAERLANVRQLAAGFAAQPGPLSAAVRHDPTTQPTNVGRQAQDSSPTSSVPLAPIVLSSQTLPPTNRQEGTGPRPSCTDPSDSREKRMGS